MKTKKKNLNLKFAEAARRDNEIEMYGRLLSLRPSKVHESKKSYNRRENKKELSRVLDSSYFYIID